MSMREISKIIKNNLQKMVNDIDKGSMTSPDVLVMR
jgi:hypothetical protein